MRVTMLGTGHGTAINCYNTCFTIDDKNEYFLVDCGGGNQILKQLNDKNIEIGKIKNIFISHTHSDHIVGIIWIVRMICRLYIYNKIEEPTCIYGNDEVIKSAYGLCELVLPPKFTDLFGEKIKFIEVKNGDCTKILKKDIKFFDINAAKVKQFGFSMNINEEKKFTFIGDETCNPATEQYVKNSEWLFADAFMAGQEAEEYNPIKKHHHSTVKFTSELAERNNVKNLILSHTIDTDLKNRKETFTHDSKNYFKGNIFVPDDLEEIELTK